MTRKCYDKETRGHWDNGTNELLAPLTLLGRREGVVPSGQPLVLWVKLPEGKLHKSEEKSKKHDDLNEVRKNSEHKNCLRTKTRNHNCSPHICDKHAAHL